MKLKTFDIGNVKVMQATMDKPKYFPRFSYGFDKTPHRYIKGYRCFLFEWFKYAIMFEFPVKR